MTKLFELPTKPQVSGFSVTRWHVLMTSVLALVAAGLCFLPDYPFHRGMFFACLISAAMHFALFLVFDRAGGTAWNVTNAVNILLLGSVIHFSGGILSPFTIFLLFIFVSGSAYGINYPTTIGLSIGVFIAVVGGEAFGLLTPIHITPQAVYACRSMTVLILLTNATHLYTAGNIYRVTVRKLRADLEEELHMRERALRRIAELDAPSQIGMLVSKIAHDMRGPIGAVKGFIYLFESRVTHDEEGAEDCRVMRGELDRLAGMIDRMIAYVKPGESPVEAVDVVELFDVVLSVINFHPAAKSIRFVRDYPTDESPLVRANKEQLQRVFFNLVKNSMEALEGRGGCISITVRKKEGSALILVGDDGPGFPSGVIEKLGEGPTSTKKGGGGMGLAISREIIEEFLGRMSLGRSTLGGAEILIELPAATSSRLEAVT